MSNLYLAAGKNSPEVKLNPDDGYFELSGVSLLENPTSFYENIYLAISDYGQSPKPLTSVNFKLRYFNTSSSKAILKVLIMFADLHKRLMRVKVNWYYDADDEDMHDTAKDLESISGLEFNYIAVRLE